MIIWFILQGILTVFIFMIYVSKGSYGGGEIGMAPTAVMLAVFIQFFFSVACCFVLKSYLIGKKRVFFFILNMLIYEIVYLFFSNDVPILNMSKSGLMGFLNTGYSLSSALSGVIIIIAFSIFSLIKIRGIK